MFCPPLSHPISYRSELISSEKSGFWLVFPETVILWVLVCILCLSVLINRPYKEVLSSCIRHTLYFILSDFCVYGYFKPFVMGIVDVFDICISLLFNHQIPQKTKKIDESEKNPNQN